MHKFYIYCCITTMLSDFDMKIETTFKIYKEKYKISSNALMKHIWSDYINKFAYIY